METLDYYSYVSQKHTKLPEALGHSAFIVTSRIIDSSYHIKSKEFSQNFS